MRLLVIDTSSRGRAVAVLADDGVPVEHCEVPAPAAIEALLPAMDGMLRAAIDAVAVATGPGSYTGVRAGMAAALGVAQARELPLFGVPSLEVVACAAPPDAEDVLAVAVAGRGALYAARYVRDGPGRLRQVEPVRRVMRTELEIPHGVTAVALDAVDVPGVIACTGAAAALAEVAAAAASGVPLARSGLAPLYEASSGG